MADPRYAPPARETEVPPSQLECDIKKWKQINLLSGIPVQLSPILVPILFVCLVFEIIPRSEFVIIPGALIFSLWIFSSFRLAKLRHRQFRSLKHPEIDQTTES